VVSVLSAAPELLLIFALAAMLFRPPELVCYSLDRFAFLVLLAGFLLRLALLHQPLRLERTAVWPLGVLLVMSLASVLTQPYEAKTWSVLAAKCFVPYVLFHIARLSFRDERSRRRLDMFGLVVLAYLCFISVASLVGARSLIVPRFILDESLGIHVNRARGPFLQAVANGVTLNILGLLALDAFRRRRIRSLAALALFVALPLAILATKTRAVWLSFLASALVLLFFCSDPRVRKACACLLFTASLVVVFALGSMGIGTSLQDRFEDRSPVEIRLAVYSAAWDMFLERPFFGWGVSRMPSQLEERVSDFHLNQFVVHNTYLEILVEHGLLGLALYAWLVLRLFGLSRTWPSSPSTGTFLDHGFRELWPVILGVYLLNGFFVVMNYQFVNGFLYTLAGLQAGQSQAEGRPRVAAS
jgi:O-antigen ligase